MGEPAAQSLHRLGGAWVVEQGGLHPGVGVCLEVGIAQQLLEGAAEAGEAARHGSLDEGRLPEAGRVEVDQPGTLALVGLGERVGQGRSAVAQRVAEDVGPVEVAERGVVDVVEEGRRDPRHAADADVTLGLRRLGAGDEGVRQDHRTR